MRIKETARPCARLFNGHAMARAFLDFWQGNCYNKEHSAFSKRHGWGINSMDDWRDDRDQESGRQGAGTE